MTTQNLPPRHYPTPRAKCADLVVHLTGLTFALFGGGVLLGLSVARGDMGLVLAVGVYALGMLAMLGFSTAYNFAKPQWRPLLRRLDHAGIFLMIAGSYTPFTTHNLEGAWAWAMTGTVWGLATLGAVGKLFLPGIGKGLWVAVYMALGWLVVIAFQPMVAHGSWIALLLLAIGGALYMTGAVFYVRKKLKWFRAIWHGHVVAAASVHWAAVLVGVVLTTNH
ncbi:PAQR family membrane homeostasis protein TrhA [Brevundimonas sp.]|uniref:PAQR family membrane homeostasis protein TrhA n=1 Tax=Brevundimonas sp. TaxID=1871086 RepID=UPI00286D0FE9|nr:hemolysin III family protein [Brevundimonas sp.]